MSVKDLIGAKKDALNNKYYVSFNFDGEYFAKEQVPVTEEYLKTASREALPRMLNTVENEVGQAIINETLYDEDISFVTVAGDIHVFCELNAYFALMDYVVDRIRPFKAASYDLDKAIKAESDEDIDQTIVQKYYKEKASYERDVEEYIRTNLSDKLLPYALVKFYPFYFNYTYQGVPMESSEYYIEDENATGIVDINLYLKVIQELGYREDKQLLEEEGMPSVSDLVGCITCQILGRNSFGDPQITFCADIPLKKDLEDSPSTLN